MANQTKKLLAEWHLYAKERADTNARFTRWTKMITSGRVDRYAREAHERVFAQLDCTQCANCCKTMSIQLEKPDIRRIAAHLQLPEAEFRERFVKANDQGLPEFNAKPCPFLADTGHCTIYEVRPKVCSGFPYTDKRGFSSRSWSHAENSVDCPAVFHILEEMKFLLRFR